MKKSVENGLIKSRRSTGSRRTGKIPFDACSKVLMKIEEEAKLPEWKRKKVIHAESLRLRDLGFDWHSKKARMIVGTWDLALLIALPLYSGFRRSDVIQLRWKDLVYIAQDAKKSTVKVQKSLIVFNEQKTKKRRELPISEELGYYIMSCYTEQKVKDLNQWVFTSKFDETKHLSNTAMTVKINQVFARFGVYDQDGLVSPHSLRKTYAHCLWKAMGGTYEALLQIQSLFNHSTLEMTLRYMDVRLKEITLAHNELSFRSKVIHAGARNNIV